jgi:hypothetical protein
MSEAMIGNTNVTQKTTYVYSLEGKLVQSFPSRVAAAKFRGISKHVVSKAVTHGHAVSRRYKLYDYVL